MEKMYAIKCALVNKVYDHLDDLDTLCVEELGEVIDKKKPKYVFCGHIHSGDHVPYTKDGVTVVNCSLKDEDYKITYKPFTFEYGSN